MNSYKLQRIFVNDLKTQFRKMIIKTGKYKSKLCAQFREIELLDTEPIYIERIFFLRSKKFLDKRNFVVLHKIFFRPKKIF